MTRALVTGSDGFIGNHLVKKLNLMAVETVCVDKDPRFASTLKMDVARKKFTEYFTNDGSNNYGCNKIDYIYHFGSPCSILQFNENPKFCVENTLKGFWNVLGLAELFDAKLIYPSSGNIYGSRKDPLNEKDPVHPGNLYGVSKSWCETMAEHSLADTLGLRIFCGYGSGEEMKGCLGSVLYQFLSRMMKGSSPLIWGDGSQMRDFIHIDDIVEGIIASSDIKRLKILNLASGVSTSYNDLVALINVVLETNILPQYVDKPLNYIEKTFADVTLMKDVLGLSPKPLEDGLIQFSEYMYLKSRF